MTDMRRVTIAVPDHIDQLVLNMRKDDRFVRCSYAEIVRQMLDLGLKAYEREAQADNQPG